LDLGGIAKGYAVDCAIQALKVAGVNGALVNAGGDLRCFGQAQAIQVRHPDEPGSIVALGRVQDAAVATSAGYFSQRESEQGTLEPLVDPTNQRCTRWQGSISVVAPDCMTADALTKIVRLAPDRAAAILAEPGAQTIVLDGQGLHMAGKALLQLESET
jgi:thiamine biosynthesis lipoprotein